MAKKNCNKKFNEWAKAAETLQSENSTSYGNIDSCAMTNRQNRFDLDTKGILCI